jgi:hypothetical protein
MKTPGPVVNLFFWGKFLPLGEKNKNPGQLMQRIFVKKKRCQNCHILRNCFV